MRKVDIAEIFGKRLFDDRVMQQMLPKNIYESIRRIRDENLEWDITVADVCAEAMKNWAIEQGATHFVHWFSPMMGLNAGKSESFIDGVEGGKPILKFTGKNLIIGEPDASSFPSGGLRTTFEARGYTAWDPTSPAFVSSNTLFIPTAFASYTGESLDQKTPLLRSLQALNKQTLRVLRAIGDKETLGVKPSVGPEQEYFVVTKELFDKRPDLKLCGHTLLGARAAKGQELEDHYYGSINERVWAFMRDVDEELWSHGIAAKTEHNETAPAQFELAVVFTNANVASDHNQLVMDLMRKCALRHGLVCLLHEKPFLGVNGSGKHNNWSLTTDTGENLLKPGKKPAENKKFLLFLSAVLAAVDNYPELLRLSATCPGNDYRLGAAEAPPAIISVFLGETLRSILEKFADGTEQLSADKRQLLTGVKSLPLLTIDDNDRNRTSPFAFTGNKFEFRMVGSSQNISFPNTVLNAIVADSLRDIADRLEAASDPEAAMAAIIGDIYAKHNRIIFNGNNYAKEWVVEAERRGLPNLSTTVKSIPSFIDPKNIALFERTKVLSSIECHARYAQMMEHYISTIDIEAVVMHDMAAREILPAAINYLKSLSKTAYNLSSTAQKTSVAVDGTIKELSLAIDEVYTAAKAFKAKHDTIKVVHEKAESANLHKAFVDDEMKKLRNACDALELIVPKRYWPFPSYTELLFDLD